LVLFDSITFTYPGAENPALDHVSLNVPVGKITALVGPNGAGKTTLLRILTGRLKQSSGHLQIPENWGVTHPDAEKVGVLIENPGIYPGFSVFEYLNFFGQFYQGKASPEYIRELIGTMHLDPNQKMKSLSLGMRQKVQIIRCLIHKPKLLLLDEPSANLDPDSRLIIWEMIGKLCQQEGTTVLVCSHVLSELESHCDMMAVIYQGRILANGSLRDLQLRHSSYRSQLIVPSLNDQDRKLILQSISDESPEIKVRPATPLHPEMEEILFSCTDPWVCHPELIRRLTEAGIPVLGLHQEQERLHALYQSILREESAS